MFITRSWFDYIPAVSSAQEVDTNESLDQLDHLRRDPTAEPVDNQQESTQPFYSAVASDFEVCDSEDVRKVGCGHQARGRSELLAGDKQHPMDMVEVMVGQQPLSRSREVFGGQPLNGGGVVAQSPAESWLSGCNSMGQMQVDDDDPPSTVTPLPPTDDPPSTVTPLPPTDDLTTIQHKIPSTPAVQTALDDCKRSNEVMYPKLITIEVPIGSEICAEEGVVRVAVRFPPQCEFHQIVLNSGCF